MPNEREDFYQPLTSADFDIGGNVFRAYSDADGKLVFVIDWVVNDVKPNVLLVINPDGNRKWDDILMNDYGVDLETVRPKKDNKYQKLDIEYIGLADYDRLIRVYRAGGDLTDALAQLEIFRNMAARRAAIERMAAADLTATRARETLDKTSDTLDELQARLKNLRGKLAAQRRDVGREPTKQSAAKILRTESQIDAVNDKLARAKKRMANAQSRIAAAADEADLAREILARLDKVQMGHVYESDDDNDDLLPMIQQNAGGVMPVVNPPLPAILDDENTQITNTTETNVQPKANTMDDEEVKPLFDTDPKILDDEIAFKPVEFDAPSRLPAVEPVSEIAPVEDVPVYAPKPMPESEPVGAIEPIAFTPPVFEGVPTNQESEPVDAEPEQPVAPVLDSLTSVNAPAPMLDSELMPGYDNAPVADVPVQPDVYASDVVSPDVPKSMPEIAVAPTTSEFRPVSPIASGADEAPMVERRRPTMLYYVLLILLIVLSVFALWMFQNKFQGDLTPNLGAEIAPVESEVVEPVVEPVVDVPVVVEPVVAEPVVVAPVVPAEPEVVPDVVPEPVPVTPPVPVAVVPDVVPEPVPVTPVIEEPVQKIPTEAEVMASKPAYNVSQNEKMFVAATDYETDVPVVAEPEMVTVDVVEPVVKPVAAKPIVVNQHVPQIVVSEPIAAEPEYVATDYAEPEYVEEEFVDTCADGNAPDADGCCTGETLTNVGGGQYVCCDEVTGDCFDPMF